MRAGFFGIVGFSPEQIKIGGRAFRFQSLWNRRVYTRRVTINFYGAEASDSRKKMKDKKYKHLPHTNLIGHYQFITFRTKESLDNYLKKLYNSNDMEKVKQYKMDKYLDQSQNGALLYGEVISKIRDYYLGYDKNIFEIEALSIMPNHIHVLLKQNDNMTNVLRVLKGGAGHLVNKTLGRKGAVWSRDYYDKAIRDEKHFWMTYEYIKYNAIKAGLNDADDRFYGRYD